MKKLTKSIVSLALIVVMLVCFCGTAFAVSTPWSSFPNQQTTSFTTHTYAVQAYLYNYSDETNSLIRNAGGIDGYFGSGTYSAVVAFQGAEDLEEDGIVGPNTWNAMWDKLYKYFSTTTYTDYYVRNYVSDDYGNSYLYSSAKAIRRVSTAVQGAVVNVWYAFNGNNMIYFAN